MSYSLTVVTITALMVGITGKEDDRMGRIVGGKNDVITERPYMVSVQDDKGHRCGGSIISERAILTANHCVPGGNPNFYKVRSGSSYTFKDGSTTWVRRIYRERNLPKGSKTDVAILELKKPLVFGPTRRPIQLWKTDWDIYVNENVVVSGWGLTLKHANLSWDGQLQTVVLQLVDWHECAKKLSSQLKFHEMCAWTEEGGKDACSGDSGGPLVIEDGQRQAQVGIVTSGWDCGQKGVPGLYTNIIHIREWIDRVIRTVKLRIV